MQKSGLVPFIMVLLTTLASATSEAADDCEVSPEFPSFAQTLSAMCEGPVDPVEDSLSRRLNREIVDPLFGVENALTRSIRDLPIIGYTADCYMQLNEQLRTGSPSPEARAMVGAIERRLVELEPYRGRVFRGTQVPSSIRRPLREGETFSNPTLVSSSTDLVVARDFGVHQCMDIQSSTGRPLEDISFAHGESEVLFFPGTRFTIQSIEAGGLPGCHETIVLVEEPSPPRTDDISPSAKEHSQALDPQIPGLIDRCFGQATDQLWEGELSTSAVEVAPFAPPGLTRCLEAGIHQMVREREIPLAGSCNSRQRRTPKIRFETEIRLLDLAYLRLLEYPAYLRAKNEMLTLAREIAHDEEYSRLFTEYRRLVWGPGEDYSPLGRRDEIEVRLGEIRSERSGARIHHPIDKLFSERLRVTVRYVQLKEGITEGDRPPASDLRMRAAQTLQQIHACTIEAPVTDSGDAEIVLNSPGTEATADCMEEAVVEFRHYAKLHYSWPISSGYTLAEMALEQLIEVPLYSWASQQELSAQRAAQPILDQLSLVPRTSAETPEECYQNRSHGALAWARSQPRFFHFFSFRTEAQRKTQVHCGLPVTHP